MRAEGGPVRKVMVIGVCMLLCGIAPFSAAAEGETEVKDLGVVHEVREKENDKAAPAALLCTSSAVGVMFAGALICGTVRRHRSRRQDS